MDTIAIVAPAIAPTPATLQEAAVIYAVRGVHSREECAVILKLIVNELDMITEHIDDVMKRCKDAWVCGEVGESQQTVNLPPQG